MSKPESVSSIFTVGGPVQAGSNFYISRQADDELLAICQRKEFAYILTPRQMGKSSLMYRTVERLCEKGVRCVVIDLNQIGTEVNTEQWYLGLLTEIGDQLMLQTDVTEWWRTQAEATKGMAQRLTKFLKEVLLAEVSGSVVIFVDEIDTTLSLDFTDDFYAAIRSIYQARAQTPEFHRLSFVLIGVATPSDLIRDRGRTPFNIGKRVDLTDLSLDEAAPFASGLNLPAGEAQRTLAWVLEWTGGHPYLTQRICRAIEDDNRAGWSQADVNQIVSKLFFGEESEKDHNLQSVSDMLTKRSSYTAAVLSAYRDVLRDESPVRDERQSNVKSHLKLSGIVRRKQGALRISNRIYREVFDESWIKDNFPVDWTKRLIRYATVLILLVLAVGAFLAPYAWSQKLLAEGREKDAKAALNTADEQRKIAEERTAEALRQRQIAESNAAQLKAQKDEADIQRGIADGQRNLAEERALELGKQRKIAEERAQEATQQRQLAELNAAKMKTEKEKADEQRKIADQQRTLAETLTVQLKAETVEAEKQRQIAEQLKDVALSRQLAAQSAYYANDQYDLSLLLGLEAAKISNTLEARSSLLDALEGNPKLSEFVRVPKTSLTNLGFTSDGQVLMWSDKDHNLTLWDPQTKQTKPTGAALPRVDLAQFAISSRGIMAVNYNGTISLYDPASDHVLFYWPGTLDPIDSMTFSSNGKILATTFSDGLTSIWNVDTKEVIGKVRVKKEYTAVGYNPLAVSSDGKLLAAGGRDGKITLWDVATGKVLEKTLTVPGGPITLLAFSSGSDMLASASRQLDQRINEVTSITLWELPSGKPRQLTESKSRIASLVFSPHEDETLVSAGVDGTILLWRNLNNSQITSETLRGHSGGDLILAFDGAGNKLVSGGSENTIILWDLNANTRIGQRIDNFDIDPKSIAFDTAGQTLLLGTKSGSIKTWDTATLSSRGIAITEHYADVTCVAVSPDGKILAAGSYDSSITLWNLSTGKKIETLNGHTGRVRGIAFSPDGKTLASGSSDESVILWDLNKRAPLVKFNSVGRGINSVAFSPDGKLLAVGTWLFIGIWDVSTKPLQPEAQRRIKADFANGISTMAFSPNGKILASGGQTGEVILWNVSSGDQLKRLEGHKEQIKSVAFSPDGKILASGGREPSIIEWNVETGEKIRQLGNEVDFVTSIAFSPDGRWLASSSLEESVILWHAASGEKIREYTGHTDIVNSITFTPDSKRLVSGSDDNTVKVWDVVGAVDSDASAEASAQTLIAKELDLTALSLSSDGKLMASLVKDNTIMFSDLSTGKKIEPRIKSESFRFDKIALSPDGKTVATGNDTGDLILWDVAARKKKAELSRFNAFAELNTPITGMAFSRDSSLIAASTEHGANSAALVKIWNVDSGKMIEELYVGTAATSLVFDPTGKTLAVAHSDRSITLWDTVTGKQLGNKLTGHRFNIISMAFSPNGEILASGSTDNSIFLWDAKSGHRLGRALSRDLDMVGLAFNPDGKTLASADEIGRITFWNMDFETWKKQALQIANRQLTCDEWEQFVRDEQRNNSDQNPCRVAPKAKDK